jgi:hypothetical protein
MSMLLTRFVDPFPFPILISHVLAMCENGEMADLIDKDFQGSNFYLEGLLGFRPQDLPHGRHSLNDDWLGSNYKRYSV